MDDPSICQSDVLKSFLSTSIQSSTNTFSGHDSIVGGIAVGVSSFLMSSYKKEGSTAGVVGGAGYEEELGGSGGSSKFSTLTKTSSKLAKMMIKKGGTLTRDAGAKLRFGVHGINSTSGAIDGSVSLQEQSRHIPVTVTNENFGGSGGGNSNVNDLLMQQQQGMDDIEVDEGPLQWGEDKMSPEYAQFGENESLAALPPLVEPLCIILLDIFEFKEQNFWLKRNAAVLLLKQWWSVRANRTLEK
jgi:hypothetical protein